MHMHFYTFALLHTHLHLKYIIVYKFVCVSVWPSFRSPQCAVFTQNALESEAVRVVLAEV